MTALILARLAGVMAGCTADLLPGERVLGDDLVAVVIDGGAGDALGGSVAVGPLGLVATTARGVRVYDLEGVEAWRCEPGAGQVQRAWWWDGEARFFLRAGGIRACLEDGDDVLVQATGEGTTAVATCPDGAVVEVSGAGSAIACSTEGVLRSDCDGSTCSVEAEGRALGTTTPGSAVAWIAGAACWSDVDTDEPQAPGVVRCHSGGEVHGLAGDHLGLALVDGKAAGLFNKWQVPARARVVDLTGGETWTVDRAAERSRVALAFDPDTALWAVGVPGWFAHEARQGRVYLVEGDR